MGVQYNELWFSVNRYMDKYHGISRGKLNRIRSFTIKNSFGWLERMWDVEEWIIVDREDIIWMWDVESVDNSELRRYNLNMRCRKHG